MDVEETKGNRVGRASGVGRAGGKASIKDYNVIIIVGETRELLMSLLE